jgi:predicted nucleotidyltransferase
MKARINSPEEILSIVNGIFPNSIIMFMYYCGSIAYKTNDEESDIDITVVLDKFFGTIHLELGTIDLFVFDKETAFKKQRLEPSVPLYYRSSIDEVLAIESTQIYINDQYQDMFEQYISVNLNKQIKEFLTGFVEYHQSRYFENEPQKSNYHILRMRGILDHLDLVGKYELVVEEPWATMMVEYKKNWDNEIGIKYMPVLERELRYIAEYRDKVMNDELG